MATNYSLDLTSYFPQNWTLSESPRVSLVGFAQTVLICEGYCFGNGELRERVIGKKRSVACCVGDHDFSTKCESLACRQRNKNIHSSYDLRAFIRKFPICGE